MIISSITIIIMFIYYSYYNKYYSYSVFNNNIELKLIESGQYMLSGHIMGTYLCGGSLKKNIINKELNIKMRYNLICNNKDNSNFSIIIEENRKFNIVTYGENRIPIKLTLVNN